MTSLRLSILCRVLGLLLTGITLQEAGAQHAAAQDAAAQEQRETLRRDFVNPPADTRPGCYWYWINDNISTAGITKDLEAMARVGIGRAYIGHIFNQRNGNGTPVGDVPFMSKAWWDALQWAVREAGRCGIEIGFFNSPGWSQSGGPWIKPSESMRYLGHSETDVVGGGAVDMVIPVPEINTYPNAGGSGATRTGPNFTANDFQDVKIVALRKKDDEADRIPFELTSFSGETSEAMALIDGSEDTSFGFSTNKEQTVTMRIPETTTGTVRSAVIKPLDHSYTLVCTAEESDDGKTFREIISHEEERGHQGPKKNDDIVVPLGQISGEYIRLKLHFKTGPAVKQVRVAGIELSGRALLAGYVRKQLGETSPKTIIPSDAYMWDTHPSPGKESVIQSDEVIDLTDKMDADGRLRWDAPPGKWTVLRMGMIPIGTQCAPSSPESRGLEIDKMNRKHAAAIFEGMTGEFLKRTPKEDRKALKYVIADSYETGPQNWSDGFVEKFETRFGYSPAPYLATLTGRVVDSPQVSDRFLWDLRRLIVESVAYEYVGGLRDVANKHGLILWLENYGHWGFISEFLLYGSQSDEIGGEYWESSDPIGNVECRSAASSAHIYGRKSVYAEAFTSGRTFKQSLTSMKPWCDWSFGAGINHIILHVYIHQPREEKPGIMEWFGTAFNRHNTWFDQSKAFMDYLRRSAVLLKSGLPVADVAYYIGENSPSMQGPMDPELPEGYDFDSINSDVLMNGARVEGGRITLGDGVSYSVLVLPKQKQMRPEVAAAVQKLVQAGAVVVGPRPDSSPSLQDYPRCDARVKSIAEEVWGDMDGSQVKERRYGKGRLYDGFSLSEVFDKIAVGPDVDIVSSTSLLCTVAGTGKLGVNKTGGVLFKHRSGKDYDIYFLSNTSDDHADIEVSFRQSGRRPFLWNAVSGKMTAARAFTQKEGRTVIPLSLQPSESVFVMFGEGIAADANGSAVSNTPDYETRSRLDGKWTVRFEGPDPPREVVFDQLSDWSTHADAGIKYFSGTATYEQSFSLSKRAGERLVLDLGNVAVIATVSVNGKPAGTVWTNPWEVDISEFVRDGENSLKIQVSNTWNNRLVGDAERKLGEVRTYVSQPYGYNREKPLLSSGLLGPVVIKAAPQRDATISKEPGERE